MNLVKVSLIIATLCLSLGIVFVGLGEALIPLGIAFGLSYLFFPLIIRVESWGIRRHIAISSLFIILVGVCLVSLVLVVPELLRDAKSFAHELPQNAAQALDKAGAMAAMFGYQLDLSTQGIKDLLVEHASMLSSDLLKGVLTSTQKIFSSLQTWFLGLLNLFLIPLFFFYVINDYEKIVTSLHSMIPGSIRPKVDRYLELANQVLSGYIRGQLLVASVLGLLYGIGLWLVGLRFGFLIGILSGAISIIPYAGFTIGFMIAMMMGLASSSEPATYGGIILVYGVVQTLEGTLITPRLVGDKVGLSSLATMLALIVGGNLLGLIGMLLAIPIAAIAKVIFADLKREIQTSTLWEPPVG